MECPGSNGVTYTVSNVGSFEDEVIDLVFRTLHLMPASSRSLELIWC